MYSIYTLPPKFANTVDNREYFMVSLRWEDFPIIERADKMDFKIGQMIIRVIDSGEVVLALPIGQHMAALRINLFQMPEHNSISAQIEIYHKGDISMVKKVQSWFGE